MSEKKITPAEAEVGMIISRPLADKQGRVIINSGGRLTPAHVKRLEPWGITELYVDIDDANSNSDKEDADKDSVGGKSESLIEQLDKEYLNTMAVVFNTRFQEVRGNALMEKIKKIAFKVIILAGKDGLPAIEEKADDN